MFTGFQVCKPTNFRGQHLGQEWIKESNRVGTPLNLIAITPVMQAATEGGTTDVS